ncbi:hypothetical protein [Aquifex sp.]
MSVKDQIKNLILDFAKELATKEAFNTELIQFKLKLKAEIVEILNISKDKELKTTLFKEIIEGFNEALAEITKNFNYEDEKLMEREIMFLEALNEVLKEFLASPEITDKHELSQLTAKISKIVERIRLELKERKGGILKKIRSLLPW